MGVRYFFSNGDLDLGPFTLNELKYGRIASHIKNDTLIWTEDSDARTRAAEIDELNKSYFGISSYDSQKDLPPPKLRESNNKVEQIQPKISKHSPEVSDMSETERQLTPPPIPNETSHPLKDSPLFVIFRKSFTLKGRASRSEFWGFQLLYFFLFFLAVSSGEAFGIYVILAFVAISIPAMFSLTVRRLHDADWSGLTVLWWLVPVGNLIPLLVCCFSGTTGANQYGPDPREKNELPSVSSHDSD